MRVLIDIKHPAEANFFRPLLRALRARGDRVLVTAHYKPEVAKILKATGVEHLVLSHALPTHAGILATALQRTLRMLRLARRFRPQIMLARVGAEIGIVGRLLGIPAISFDENEYARVQLLISTVLAHRVCTGMGYEKALGPKQVRFNALPQLVYTHPAQFTPDPEALRAAGVEPTEPYVVLRLSEWTALHDIGHRGMSDGQALALARALSRHARVLASRPAGLSAALAPYGHSVPADRNLDLLAFARLYVGEGGSHGGGGRLPGHAGRLGEHAELRIPQRAGAQLRPAGAGGGPGARSAPGRALADRPGHAGAGPSRPPATAGGLRGRPPVHARRGGPLRPAALTLRAQSPGTRSMRPCHGGTRTGRRRPPFSSQRVK